MRETETHIYFWGGFLSNWEPSNLTMYYDGEVFKTSEQLFMYIKAKFFNDNATAFEIVELGADDPAVAKELGRKVSGYDEEKWEAERENAMFIAVLNKFRSSEALSKLLIATGNKILVEGSPADIIWGVGLHWKDDAILDEAKWRGRNLLGKVLMKVREVIQHE